MCEDEIDMLKSVLKRWDKTGPCLLTSELYGVMDEGNKSLKEYGICLENILDALKGNQEALNEISNAFKDRGIYIQNNVLIDYFSNLQKVVDKNLKSRDRYVKALYRDIQSGVIQRGFAS